MTMPSGWFPYGGRLVARRSEIDIGGSEGGFRPGLCTCRPPEVVVTIAVGVMALAMLLDQIGIALGPLLASAGVVGLAIGFGAQSLVADYLSGLLIMLEDQYGVGDSVDLGEAIGEVEHVGLRLTQVRDLNGGLWHIRNGEILRGNDSQEVGTRRSGRFGGMRVPSRHRLQRLGADRSRHAPRVAIRLGLAGGPLGLGSAVPGTGRRCGPCGCPHPPPCSSGPPRATCAVASRKPWTRRASRSPHPQRTVSMRTGNDVTGGADSRVSAAN